MCRSKAIATVLFIVEYIKEKEKRKVSSTMWSSQKAAQEQTSRSWHDVSQYFDCYYNSNRSAQWGFGLKQISQWGNARSLPAGQNALHGGQASKRTWRSVVCVSFQQEETQFRACLAWYKLLWNIVTINASWHCALLVPCHTQLAPFPFCFFVVFF